MSAERQELEAREPRQIAGMFDAIAGRYDLLNRTLSAGLDRRWRRLALEALRLSPGDVFLDLCTGTADLAIGAARLPGPPARVLGIDFAGRMLEVGREKVRRAGLAIPLLQADASRLPLASSSIDAAAIAFGIRNVSSYPVVLGEIHRTLRAGGRLVILEFGLPRSRIWGRLYGWYFGRVLPRVGRSVSGHRSAYAYLPASVGGFPQPDGFTRYLEDAGFVEARVRPLTGGVVHLYSAAKAAPAGPGGASGV